MVAKSYKYINRTRKVLGNAKNLSMVRRLSRFLVTPAIQVREWYEPISRQCLEAQFTWLGEVPLLDRIDIHIEVPRVD
jgi:hypothetical protein